MRCCHLAIVLILVSTACFSQNPVYPRDFFQSPVRIPILLAGNFGECRPNHFHSGIDIKTAGKENLPVYAAGDGYISRIKTEAGGFGHAIYITHPNGFTTLYAHLNNYVQPLQDFLRREQYKAQNWSIDVTLTAGQFPVKRGDQIAFSGNTGASTAPHLHFEIRDSKTEHPLNPLLFGLPVEDHRAPVAQQLYLYDMHTSIYEQVPRVIDLKRSGNDYITGPAISFSSDQIGIGLVADDFMEGSDNTLNFYTAEWSIDGVLQGKIRLDNIGYEETRYLHAYVDYATKFRAGKWVQLLFRLPNNHLGHIYESMSGSRGALELQDTEMHQLSIILTDAMGNASTITGALKRSQGQSNVLCDQPFLAGQSNSFNNTNIKFTLADDALYDNTCFYFKQTTQERFFSDRFTVHQPYVPEQSYFSLSIKPNKAIPFAQRNKIVMRYNDGKDENGQAATFADGWYTASVRKFGDYWLVADTTAPVIISLNGKGNNFSKTTRISFTVRDDLSSVKTVRGELDGKWLIFEQHESNWFYEMDAHCSKGSHNLVITATDESGNVRKMTMKFVR